MSVFPVGVFVPASSNLTALSLYFWAEHYINYINHINCITLLARYDGVIHNDRSCGGRLAARCVHAGERTGEEDDEWRMRRLGDTMSFNSEITSLFFYPTHQSGRDLQKYQNQAKQLFRKLNEQSPNRCTLEAGDVSFQWVNKAHDNICVSCVLTTIVSKPTTLCCPPPSYLLEQGVCYLILCDALFPKKMAFGFLEDLQAEFHDNYAKKVASVTRPYSFIEFGKWHCVHTSQCAPSALFYTFYILNVNRLQWYGNLYSLHSTTPCMWKLIWQEWQENTWFNHSDLDFCCNWP